MNSPLRPEGATRWDHATLQMECYSVQVRLVTFIVLSVKIAQFRIIKFSEDSS